MDLNIKDKVYIVSGGSKGIGEGITRTLLAEQAQVMMVTRSKEATDKLYHELKSQGHHLGYYLGDLSDESHCKAAVEATIEQFGRLDGVVNNAGVNDGASLEKGPAAFKASISTNLFHYYNLVHFALPYLKESRGAIVNISSKVAITGQGNTSGYAASKGAQLALTREWAAELLPYGIRVNAILPAEVMTPLYSKWLERKSEDPGAEQARITNKIPLGKRMTTVQEIADMAIFLLSDRSGHTTGQWIVVDGGYVHLDRSLT